MKAFTRYWSTIKVVSVIAFEILLGVVGLALVVLGIYGILRDKFRSPATGGAMGATINVQTSSLLVILGLGSLGFAGYLGTSGSAKNPLSAPSVTPNIPTSSPTIAIPKSPVPTATVLPANSPTRTVSPAYSPTATVPPTRPPITLSCTLSRRQLSPGVTVQLTYHVYSLSSRQVGLGAGLYDNQGNDHSNGDGDVDSTTLPQGLSSPSRPVVIPANLPSGRYELDAEIWPANEIGDNNVNDIIDTTCTYITVP